MDYAGLHYAYFQYPQIFAHQHPITSNHVFGLPGHLLKVADAFNKATSAIAILSTHAHVTTTVAPVL
ncbi:hypothetical protein [Nostoc favosum]|uniref:Uncharacterized protein n=1 Tax=Nostoc favosum CHAB5714 TaxID=2780399 RepID=A0ABS8IM07_9NOSO|nr:hypothetical protein [Nostoc favosum]MCC5604830.1 hypothetical protein [Nostoc favosum CHAB5714]